MRVSFWVLLFCCGAQLCYALEICFTDFKLTKVNPRVLTLLYSGGVFVFSLMGILAFRPQPGENGQIWPRSTEEWGWVAAMAGVSYIAAMSHFSALTHQSGAVLLTMFYVLLPVVAATWVFVLKGQVPDWRLFVALLLGGIALYLVVSISEQPPPVPPPGGAG